MNDEIRSKFEDIKRFLDNELHPVVTPDNYWVYSRMFDLIAELEDLIEEHPKEI